MASLIELQHKVKVAIAPWRQSLQCPPFSREELITFALIEKHERLTLKAILEWVLQTFDHYKYFGELDLPSYGLVDSTAYNSVSAPLAKWEQASRHLDLPVTAVLGPSFFATFTRQIDVPEAWTFLQPALGESPKGVFPFLKLPPEIRDKIYRMVFRYPASGIELKKCDRSGEKTLQSTTADFSARFSSTLWRGSTIRPPTTYQKPIAEVFSLLLVNKQVFEEAFACFYRDNLFFFRSLGDMSIFLQNLPRYRRQHITQMGFKYDFAPGKSVCKSYISTVTNLNFAQRGPGVSTLKAIRGVQKVEFSNHSPILESILKASMEGPASKRSKELAVEMKEWSRPKRAAASKNIRKA